jgi:2-C-methyl-D-erythritol 4-phosphate cytidylyltransferase/2-C-methyl-D-erythritol 2,4-cyclodiphosphate synthase
MPRSVAALVLAAGRGLRSGGGIPKQYRSVAGKPVVRRSLELFLGHPRVAHVQPVLHPDDREFFNAATAGLAFLEPVCGGATRQASVLAGLAALEKCNPDIVLVHDAARPFASAALLDRAIETAAACGAAIPAVAVTDTIKAVDREGRVTQTIDRSALRAVQTPQAFDFRRLLEAHRAAARKDMQDFTDDAALAEWAGLAVMTFEGEAGNMKLTTADDFVKAAAADFDGLGDIRSAMGFDVHTFGPGDHVTLGGVRIAHDQAISGHSDADVALHALVDAILGALADGDIGSHFPPSDPQWRGASSDRFLRFAVERVAARGGRIAHLDMTIVCEAPKIGPHRDAIRTRVAEIADVTVDRVSVKATTNERLGFIGRREGIVAYANATIRLPWGASDAG